MKSEYLDLAQCSVAGPCLWRPEDSLFDFGCLITHSVWIFDGVNVKMILVLTGFRWLQNAFSVPFSRIPLSYLYVDTIQCSIEYSNTGGSISVAPIFIASNGLTEALRVRRRQENK